MITQKDLGFLGIEVTVAPDEDYEYLVCKNMEEEGWFYLRRRDDVVNFYLVDKSSWDDRECDFTKMRNKHLLNIGIITRETSFTLPSYKQAHNRLKQNEN